MVAGFLIAAATVVGSVTFLLTETDFWQHLLVGRAIWQLHRVPTTELWTWPTYGAPDVNSSWGFRALLWPLWKWGGVWGLFAWRWLATLGAFALLWLTARRMGARGFGPLAVVAIGAALYRLRSQIRPETLVAVWLALEIWILETRRHGGPDRSRWLVPLAIAWVNSHISNFLFFVVLGIHAFHDLTGGSARGAARPGPAETARPGSASRSGTAGGGADGSGLARHPAGVLARLFAGRGALVAIGLVSLAAMLLNPWGWRALWQPFQYFLFMRNEPMYQQIGELYPLRWSQNLWNGLPLVVVFAPLLFLWRWRRRGLDRVELMMLAVFGAMAASSVRFLGFFALAIVPYLSRDLDDWLGTRRWPAWTSLPPLRLAAVAAVAFVVLVPIGLAPDARPGVGILWNAFPVSACDFVARNDIRGRVFNSFELGGYLLYRFWPERDRLPFMDIHQAGTPEDRSLYVYAHEDPQVWRRLDDRYRFDWIVLARHEAWGDRLMDTLDADSTWALVFVDDAAVIYLRRHGALARLAPLAFHELKAGHQGLRALGEACAADSLERGRARAELERMASLSRANAGAHNFLASIARMDGRDADAARHLRAALAADPLIPRAHQGLGDLALAAGRWREAATEYGRELDAQLPDPTTLVHLGIAWRRLGERGKARQAFADALELDPGNAEARDSLEAMRTASR
jgi:Flp pilus assembly protein TadD